MLTLLLACEPPPGDPPPVDAPTVGSVGVGVLPPGSDPVVHGDVVLGDEEDIRRLRPFLEVEGDLVLEGTAVEALELPWLRRVGGELRIWENPALAVISLPSLASVGGDLSLYDDPVLADLRGLGALEEVGGSLVLNRLPGLTDLAGLERLRQADRLYLFHDLGLRRLDGLESLETVAGPIQVWEDHALVELRLPSLRAAGRLDLFDARSLERLELPVLEELGALELHHCDALVDLDGALPALGAVRFELTVIWNPVLASLDGLEGIASAGSLRLEQLPALQDTDGLAGLSTVAGDLSVERVGALRRLGLDALEEAGPVEVRGCAALEDPGLGSLRTAAGLLFEEDPSLPDCAVEALFQQVDAPVRACSGLLPAGCASACAP